MRKILAILLLCVASSYAKPAMIMDPSGETVTLLDNFQWPFGSNHIIINDVEYHYGGAVFVPDYTARATIYTELNGVVTTNDLYFIDGRLQDGPPPAEIPEIPLGEDANDWTITTDGTSWDALDNLATGSISYKAGFNSIPTIIGNTYRFSMTMLDSDGKTQSMVIANGQPTGTVVWQSPTSWVDYTITHDVVATTTEMSLYLLTDDDTAWITWNAASVVNLGEL